MTNNPNDNSEVMEKIMNLNFNWNCSNCNCFLGDVSVSGGIPMIKVDLHGGQYRMAPPVTCTCKGCGKSNCVDAKSIKDKG